MKKVCRVLLMVIQGSLLLYWPEQTQAQELSQVFTEEQRLLGFAQHNRVNRDSDRTREAGAAEIKRKKTEWDQHLQDAVKDYKEWKKRQAQSLDEKSSEYRLEKENQRQQIKASEEAQASYVRERNRRLAKQKTRVLLTEEQEYHLDEVVDRAEIKNRTLFGGQAPWLKGMKPSEPGSSSGVSAPSAPSYSGSPPPPPPPNEANFYEPEIPPPPPPMPFDGFDEPPPPMPFDESQEY